MVLFFLDYAFLHKFRYIVAGSNCFVNYILALFRMTFPIELEALHDWNSQTKHISITAPINRRFFVRPLLQNWAVKISINANSGSVY